MKKTAKARFNAALRLGRHQTFLLWSTSLYSAGLIILPLLAAFEIPFARSESTSALIQIILALLVLVFTLILSGSRFGLRAEAMHRCGLALNDLCARIIPYCQTDETNIDVYFATLDKESNVIAGYENHETLDFDWVKLDFPEEHPATPGTKRALWCRYCFHFSPYAFLVMFFIAACLFLFIPATTITPQALSK